MAVLTWQNVASPDFRGSMDGLRIANVALNQGFSGLSDALGKFQDYRKEGAESAVLNAASKFQDPVALREALSSGTLLQGVDPSLLGRQQFAALEGLMAGRIKQAGDLEDNAQALRMNPLLVNAQQNTIRAQDQLFGHNEEYLPIVRDQGRASASASRASAGASVANTERTRQNIRQEAELHDYKIDDLRTWKPGTTAGTGGASGGRPASSGSTVDTTIAAALSLGELGQRALETADGLRIRNTTDNVRGLNPYFTAALSEENPNAAAERLAAKGSPYHNEGKPDYAAIRADIEKVKSYGKNINDSMAVELILRNRSPGWFGGSNTDESGIKAIIKQIETDPDAKAQFTTARRNRGEIARLEQATLQAAQAGQAVAQFDRWAEGRRNVDPNQRARLLRDRDRAFSVLEQLSGAGSAPPQANLPAAAPDVARSLTETVRPPQPATPAVVPPRAAIPAVPTPTADERAALRSAAASLRGENITPDLIESVARRYGVRPADLLQALRR